MERKKWLVWLCTGLLLMGLLSGCSPTETAYYNLQKEINNLKLYESTGEISIDINQLPADQASEDDAVQMAITQTLFKNFSINYEVKADVNKQISSNVFYLKDKKTGNKNEIISIIGNGDVQYVKVSELINLIKMFDDSDSTREFESAIGDAKYISIDMKELMNIFAEEGSMTAQTALYSNFGYDVQQKQNRLYERFSEGLMENVYDEYTTGVVKRVSNKYILSLDANQLCDLIEPFLIYSINHIEPLGDYLKTFVNNLDEEEMMLLSLNPEQKAFFIDNIDQWVTTIAEDREQSTEMVNEIKNTIADDFVQTFEGSNLSVTMEKQNSGRYVETTKMALKMTDNNHPDNTIDITIDADNTTKVIQPFSVSIPETGVITFTELQEKMPKTMDIDVDYGFYTLSHGLSSSVNDVDVRIIDDRTYLPMRQVAEAFNEEVGWDAQARQAYIVRNGQRIDMTGTIINDRTYIKIRDFEKLGYVIQWNGETRTATIIKNR